MLFSREKNEEQKSHEITRISRFHFGIKREGWGGGTLIESSLIGSQLIAAITELQRKKMWKERKCETQAWKKQASLREEGNEKQCLTARGGYEKTEKQV